MEYRKLESIHRHYYLINFTISHKEMKKVMEASQHVHKILLQHFTEKRLY